MSPGSLNNIKNITNARKCSYFKKKILFLNKSLTAVSLADKAHKNHKETNDLHLSAAAPEMQK